MDELYGKLYEALGRLKRLRISNLFPEMTKTDCMTLLAIDHFNKEKDDGVLTVSELAEKIHMKPSAVSRTLKGLDDRGLIERTVNRADRRNTYVTVSEKGHEEWKRMEAQGLAFAQAVFSRMSAEDVEHLISYVNRFASVAEEEIARIVSERAAAKTSSHVTAQEGTGPDETE